MANPPKDQTNSKDIEDRLDELWYDLGLGDYPEAKSQILQLINEARKPYDELIFAVETKIPNQTRHETALMYIRQAENPPSQTEARLNKLKEGNNE